jgi:PBSX family phage terminase large subunit
MDGGGITRKGVKRNNTIRFQPFSLKQRKVITWWMPGSPVSEMEGIVADGAIRSGKTLSMALSFVIWAMETFTGEQFGMCGKTTLAFRRNVLSFLLPVLHRHGYTASYNRSDNVIQITDRRGRRNVFYVLSGKDERSADFVQGLTLAGCFLDEVALMPESFVNQVTARCSVDSAKQWFNCNPEGPQHYFKKHWINEAEKKNLFYLHFTMEDNLSLSEKVKQSYKGRYTGVFARRFIDGEWAVADGVIYEMFDEARHVLPEIPMAKEINCGAGTYISIDYGTQNATVFLLWQKHLNGTWIVTKEYYYSGRDAGKQKTDAEYADDLQAFIPRREETSGLANQTNEDKPMEIDWVIVDPSAASFIAELKQRGFVVKPAKNDVVDGIRLTRTLLSVNAIQFVSSCKHMFEEIRSYAWDEKAAERGEDKPIKEGDHAMDALRYFVYTKIRRDRKWADV